MKVFTQTMVASIGIALAGCATQSINSQLQRYGFTELRPPSRLTPPGTIIRITSRNPLQGSTVCPAKTALGPRVSDPQFVGSSDSASAEMTREFKGTFSLDANYLERLKLNAKFEAIKDVRVQLSNVKLFELSDTSVFKLVKDRDPECAAAIRFRNEQKQDLTMINYALVADANYTISWSRRLETRVKAEITKEVAANLGIEVSSSGDDAFKGANLIWGVRDDANLLKITTNLVSTGAIRRAARLPGGQPLVLMPE